MADQPDIIVTNGCQDGFLSVSVDQEIFIVPEAEAKQFIADAVRGDQ